MSKKSHVTAALKVAPEIPPATPLAELEAMVKAEKASREEAFLAAYAEIRAKYRVDFEPIFTWTPRGTSIELRAVAQA